ncbi:hypothetical protein [Nocardia sp. NPDC047038]|uniref:hypothetical protein n=1 Tax=Nocardia sp. NPDC047038 TaxID=3154338 RepID=UPI0033D5C7CA
MPADVTFTEEIAIHSDTNLYRRLAAPDAPDWAALLADHLDRWFALFYPSSKQHDPLALTVALELPFVELSRFPITVRADARTSAERDGQPTWVATGADYPAFRRWLTAQLTDVGL